VTQRRETGCIERAFVLLLIGFVFTRQAAMDLRSKLRRKPTRAQRNGKERYE
jgi:hypothetical protein